MGGGRILHTIPEDEEAPDVYWYNNLDEVAFHCMKENFVISVQDQEYIYIDGEFLETEFVNINEFNRLKRNKKIESLL